MKRLFILGIFLLNSAAHAALKNTFGAALTPAQHKALLQSRVKVQKKNEALLKGTFAPRADVIRLKSNDGAYVDMPVAVAPLSKMLVDMQGDVGSLAGESIEVPFRSRIIWQGVKILQLYNQLLGASYADAKKALIEFGLIMPENAVGILNFLNYLNAFDAHPTLVDAVALMAWNEHPNIMQLQRLLPPELVKTVARAEFIHHRFDVGRLDVKPVADFDLSIADLARRGLLPPVSVEFTLKDMRISSLVGLGDVEGIGEIENLYLSNNRLTELSAGTFVRLSNLRELDLHRNKLIEIRAEVFMGLDNLRELYLSYNQLRELREGAFVGLDNLQVLHLDHNQLTEIRDGAFAGLHNLLVLRLNHNQLTEIRDGTFAELLNLQDLCLNHNQLTAIQAETFAGLTRELNLNCNRFTPANIRELREHLPNVQIEADDQAPSL